MPKKTARLTIRIAWLNESLEQTFIHQYVTVVIDYLLSLFNSRTIIYIIIHNYNKFSMSLGNLQRPKFLHALDFRLLRDPDHC